LDPAQPRPLVIVINDMLASLVIYVFISFMIKKY